MKLSCKKRWGFVHVRGGTVVTVAHDHAVSVASYSPDSNTTEYQRRFSSKWVTARVGDVAIEIVATATGKVLGHAYFSGDAICLHRYGAAPDYWYAPAAGWHVEFPNNDTIATRTQSQVVAAILRCKYAPPPTRLIAFEIKVADMDEGKMLGRWFAEAYKMAPVPASEGGLSELATSPIDTVESLAHLVGNLFSKKKGGASMHFQPPSQPSQYAVSTFQVELALTSKEFEKVDVFDGPAFERRLYPDGVPA